MGPLFFLGGRAAKFAETTRLFVQAAGGQKAHIALLFASSAPGWDRYLSAYAAPWEAMGAQVFPVYPPGESLVLGEEMLERLRTCTGIFMCGGETRRYYQVYAQGAARQVIVARYQAGIPYGGLSAGALIAPTPCLVWGDRLTTECGVLTLQGSEHGCDAELEMGEGFGFLRDILVEAHFTRHGGFGRLVAAMEQSGAARGLGLDDPICLEIRGQEVAVHGQGRAYLLERLEIGRLEVRVFEPGQRFTLG